MVAKHREGEYIPEVSKRQSFPLLDVNNKIFLYNGASPLDYTEQEAKQIFDAFETATHLVPILNGVNIPDLSAFVAIIHDAFRASDFAYTTRHAVAWGEDFQFPKEVVEADTSLVVEHNHDMSLLCKTMRERTTKEDRFSEARVFKAFGGNPYNHLSDKEDLARMVRIWDGGGG